MNVEGQLIMGDSDTMRGSIALTLLHTICGNSSLSGMTAMQVVQYAFALTDEYLLQSDNHSDPSYQVSSFKPPGREAPQRTEGTGGR